VVGKANKKKLKKQRADIARVTHGIKKAAAGASPRRLSSFAEGSSTNETAAISGGRVRI
jgi:hypothetical protein